MNDLFGLAPNAYTTARELRLLMANFGPQSSRFILTAPAYPAWHQQLLNEFEHCGDIERERIKTVLSRAKSNHALIDKKNLSWSVTATWTENAIKVWKTGGDFKKIYVSDDEHHALERAGATDLLSFLVAASEPEPFTPADEQIATSPESYWRTSKILCAISSDIHFVDPYLNPLKRDFRGIFDLYLQQLSKNPKVKTINFWVRDKSISDYRNDQPRPSIRDIIVQGIANRLKDLTVNFNLLADEAATDKLHARYILTESGGIKFDQGFQKLPEGRFNIVSPIGLDLHQTLYKKFSHREFDFKISSTISVP